MITGLIAPTENQLKPLLGNSVISSTIPEEYGADILFFARNLTYGIQRKEFPHDFVLSVYDGRLARATTLMRDKCDYSLLLLEGRPFYNAKGFLQVNSKMPYHMKKSTVEGVLWTAWITKGVPHDWTYDVRDTAEFILRFSRYLEEEKHTSLITRPKVKGAWVTPSNEEELLWVLQSFGGVGPGIAQHILDKFKGDIPIKWTCSLSDLESIQGLSRDKARTVYQILNGPLSPEQLAANKPVIVNTKTVTGQTRQTNIAELIARMKNKS